MSLYSFDQLLGRLPDCDPFPTTDPLPSGVGYVGQGAPVFIPPDLSDLEDGVTSSNQVLIVSAPGAVGKTTLAREIAFRKNALLWNLASAHEVGSGSLSGMLLAALRAGHTEDFLEYLKEGLQFIVVDALDEGRLKVNESSFRRLLEDVGQAAQRAAGTCFVLLGRTRIAEEAWWVLDEENVRTSILQIEPFDRRQANQYIDLNVRPDRHRIPFYECRDLIFEQLAFSVTGNPESDSANAFLHYPPVLDVIATLLKAEPNLLELKNSLSAESTGAKSGSIDLLRSVITRILKREQTKVLPAIRQSLNERAKQLNWSDWNSLYSTEEQCKRLLGSVFHTHFPVAPDGLPDALKTLYEGSDEIETGLAEHPFLQGVDRFANRVFESYLYSCALLDDFGYRLKQLVTQELLRPGHLPTRLLAAFYMANSPTAPDKPRTIMPQHLGIVYDSLLSSESSRTHVRLNVDGPDPLTDPDREGEPVEVDFEFLTQDSQGDIQTSPSDPVTFALPIQQDSKISFASYLRDARITVPCTVELGTDSREVTLGPAVHIIAEKLIIRSSALIVRGRAKPRSAQNENDAVILESRACDAPSLNSPPTVHTGSEFSVSWPGAERYPWRAYRSASPEREFADDEDLLTVYQRFKRIATAFRSGGRGRLARTQRKIENQRVLQGELGQRILDQLRKDEILTLEGDGGMYFWNSERADKLLGVSWHDLSKGEIPPRLRRYLSKFVNENPHLFKRS